MPILMSYWKTVWSTAMKQRDHGYHSHSAAEAVAFQRRLDLLRDTMPSGC